MRLVRHLLLGTVLFTAGCDDLLTVNADGSSDIRVINASRAPIDVLVDGKIVLSGLAVSRVSEKLTVTPGAHTVRLRAVGDGSSADLSVTMSAGSTLTTVASPSTGSALAASVLADSGSSVPVGKSKLRVSHLSAGAPAVDIWRTQPDFATPIRVMLPFVYLATSPYLQSDPGSWEVFVTPAGSTAPLVSTGAIVVPSGHRMSVVLLDSAGVLRLRLIAD